MGILLIIIGVILLVLGLIGAIRSVFAKERKASKKTRLQIIVGIFVLIIGMAATPTEDSKKEDAEAIVEKEMNGEEKDKNKNKESDNKEVSGKANDQTLPFSVEEFRENFDKIADEYELPYRTNKEAEIEEGEIYNTQSIVTASDYVKIFATITKDRSIVSINLVGSGDGTAESGMQIIKTIEAAVGASQPDLSTEQREEILKQIGVIGEGDFSDDIISTDSDGVKYSFSYNENTGVMFFIEPSE